jgi:small subunit ribosomal protein S18
VKNIDYKDTAMLSRFISDRGKIEPRRRTGTCNRHQHTLAMAIKQARHVALLPFVPAHIHRQGQVPPLNLAPPAPPKAEVEKPAETVAAPAVETVAEAPAES